MPRRVLVLDEPTAMLDPAGRAEVLDAVRGLRAEGLAVVYVTQEMDEVVGADRVVALERGVGRVRGRRAPDCSARPSWSGGSAWGCPRPASSRSSSPRADGVLAPLPLTMDELAAALGGAG